MEVDQKALFRLTEDARETHDVSGRYPFVAEELLRLKRELVLKADSVAAPAVKPGAELRERLRSLGYVK